MIFAIGISSQVVLSVRAHIYLLYLLKNKVNCNGFTLVVVQVVQLYIQTYSVDA